MRFFGLIMDVQYAAVNNRPKIHESIENTSLTGMQPGPRIAALRDCRDSYRFSAIFT